jgi:lipopolysaccharide transport system permease protein
MASEENELSGRNKDRANERIQITVIAPSHAWWTMRLGEIWRYRELLYFLAWRDIKVRYKQAVLGVLWALIQPFAKMVVFSLVFGRLAGIDSGGVPYAVFVYAGLLPWGFFADAVSRSGHSLVAGATIVRKAYVPRLIMPVASASATLLDYAISLAILLVLMTYYGLPWNTSLLLVIPLTFATLLVALGVGLFASALNAAYRDVQHVIPFLIQIWMFLTPVVYPVTAVPPRYQWVILANPMTGIITAYRAAILGAAVPWRTLGISVGIALGLLMAGLAFFRSMDRYFADVV